MRTLPAEPAAEAPTTTLMLPTRPVDAAPVDNRSQPLLPEAASPLVREIGPDAPADAAASVCRRTAPLPPLSLPPDDTTTAPPTAPTLCRDQPDESIKEPPVLVPLPTVTLTDPARPPVLDPLLTEAQPELPDTDAPVCSWSDPDTPAEDTLDVINVRDPEPEEMLLPVRRVIEPPVAAESARPASTITAAPCPLADAPAVTLMVPALPEVADPVDTTIGPELPFADGPVLRPS